MWTPTRMEADVVLRTPNHRASLCAGDGRDRCIAAIRAPSEPAGEYTLYSIPTEKGGLLLINTQTGQGGTTYNEDRDLGRVDLTRTTLHESVEVFTIRVEETEEGGVLKLQWGMTELSVPFGVE